MKRTCLNSDDGNILIMSVVIVALLVATGLGYMRWAADEKWDSEYERASIQAYFVAQTGLIERGLIFLRTRDPADLPQGTVILSPGEVKDRPNGEVVGTHYRNMVAKVAGAGGGNLFQRTDDYDLYSTGRVMFKGRQIHQQIPVERTATLRARLRSFANYMYLTDKEVTKYGEIIWFWTPDTLWGRTHSNDFIGLKLSPTFYGPVSTSKGEFRYYNPGNIYFAYPPVFNAPPVNFPKEAKTLRAGARHVTSNNGQLMTWIKMKGDQGIDVYQYPLGGSPAESLLFHMTPPGWAGLFVDGQCEIEGELTGQLTIGSSDNMWLVDNIRYKGSNAITGDFQEDAMSHILGLVSEKDILIQDNFKNGKWDGYNAEPNNNERHSIVINAGMVALGESFSFEHQNDEWDLYKSPTTPDERGYIWLKGAVTQLRRGYVHRSNHVGTGYGKSYHYDFRFDRRPPPFYLEALDENGHGLFDIVSWGEQRPTR